MPKPIYAFADSRLLFWKQGDGSFFLNKIRESFTACPLSAAYIGASNRDSLEIYHAIFEPAMRQIGIENCEMILSRPTPDNGRFLDRADIVLLAGGSVEVGWRAFEMNGVRDLLLRRFYENSVLLIGISAGAVQLGRGGLADDGSQILSTFGLLPFYVGAHEETDNWMSLRSVMNTEKMVARGVGIPSGGGLIYDSGTGEVRPICNYLLDILIEKRESHEALIFPYTGHIEIEPDAESVSVPSNRRPSLIRRPVN